LQRSVFVSHFAEKLGMPMAQLAGHLDSSSENRIIPPPIPPAKKDRTESIVPLSMPQKQLLEFMVLQPKFFSRLEEGGLRECLAGGVGEILFLQFKGLLAKNPEAEPEELLTVLSEGVERTLIADLLVRAQNHSVMKNGDNASDDSGDEFADLLDYLEKYHLKKSSEELMKRMQRAQQDGDIGLMQELMMKKIEITRKLHGEQV
jgi:hypothetical protein